jgi:hypothetical protein
MFKNLLLLIIFSLLINWTISLQLLNQSTQDKNIKIVAISLSLFIGVLSGFVLRFSL